MLSSDQRLSQSIRIFIRKAGTIEVRVGGMDNPVMIWANHEHVGADITPARSQIVDVVCFSERSPIYWFEILTADLATTRIERLESIR